VTKTSALTLLQRVLGRPGGSSVPPGCRVYAVGDIHGRSDLLERLLRLIRQDSLGRKGKNILVFIGDYIDRGPDSKGVIELLLDLPSRYDVHFLRGNHDQSLLDFLGEPSAFRTWREFGAVDTLLSYGVFPPLADTDVALKDARDRFMRAFPRAHRRFLENLSLWCEVGDYFFTHAGVRPGIPLTEQRQEDLLWIREEFLSSTHDFGKVIVHGHTPMASPVRKTNRIGIDTGAYLTSRLTAVALEGTACRFLQSP
jgi:serine/threonine protein phosphatase 1